MREKFKTLNDPVLETMLAATEDFLDALYTRSPRWLSFVGNSGTGKTFLGEMIMNLAYSHDNLRNHHSLISPILKCFWPKLLSQLRSGEYWRVADISDANFVLLDEIAVEHDPSGFGRDKLCEILSCRVGKWTVLTSNLDMQKLAAIDGRISSRMIRGGSVVIEANTVDFYTR